MRDLDKTNLNAALDAAETISRKITYVERFALGDPESIYAAPDGTKPEDVANGVKFIEKGKIEKEARDVLDLRGLMYGWPYKDKAEADKWAEELNAAVAALQTILDNNQQIGTGFTESNILYNVLVWLNAPERSGYPYLASSQPLIQGKTYEFPQYATDIVIDGKGNKADIELRWIDNHESECVIITGNTLTIAECEEPHNPSFTAMAAGYKDPVTGHMRGMTVTVMRPRVFNLISIHMRGMTSRRRPRTTSRANFNPHATCVA